MTTKPLADLSYRHYAGPSTDRNYAWWTIARNLLTMNLKKRALWVLAAISGWWYLVLMVMIYVFEQIAAQSAGLIGSSHDRFSMFINQFVWRDQYVIAFGFQQIICIFLAMLTGAASVSNDFRSNALLVYFAKPCSKAAYVFGKWLGVFLSLCVAFAVPHLFFYLYGSLSYGDYNFFTQDRTMVFRMLVMIVLMAAFYASLTIGVSSLTRQGRVAGVVLAGIFFLSNFFTHTIGLAIVQRSFMDNKPLATTPASLLVPYYSSVDGAMITLSKNVMNYDGKKSIFGGPDNRRNDDGPMSNMPPAPIWLPITILVGVTALGIGIAFKKVRAVEVVQ
jgi:ABC-2 type transport system permease protein